MIRTQALRGAAWKCETCGYIQVDPFPLLELPPLCRYCLLGEWPDDRPKTPRWTWSAVWIGGLLIYSAGISLALWVCWIAGSLH